jgi:hypothetical protein
MAADRERRGSQRLRRDLIDPAILELAIFRPQMK